MWTSVPLVHIEELSWASTMQDVLCLVLSDLCKIQGPYAIASAHSRVGLSFESNVGQP